MIRLILENIRNNYFPCFDSTYAQPMSYIGIHTCILWCIRYLISKTNGNYNKLLCKNILTAVRLRYETKKDMSNIKEVIGK